MRIYIILSPRFFRFLWLTFSTKQLIEGVDIFINQALKSIIISIVDYL